LSWGIGIGRDEQKEGFVCNMGLLMSEDRMYQSMHDAMEELRTMDAPAAKDAGRLYRIATEKKGIFGHGGVPIEYARLQTDTPGREPWNHGWTR
jgi:large subunit ribosomal protein L40